MAHFFSLLVFLCCLEVAFSVGQWYERRRQYPYPYTWRCPEPKCGFFVNAQTQPTINWAVLRHEDVHKLFNEETEK